MKICDKYGICRQGYNENVRIKFFFSDRWQSSTMNEKIEIAEDIISGWGGINTNYPSTIRRYVDLIVNNRIEDLVSDRSNRVSSYSKILAFIDPMEYAIYDARVAASLVAI